MTKTKRLKSVQVTGLQEMFDYSIEFPESGDLVILIAPNGYGKTALLNLINCCLQFQIAEAAKLRFKTLDIIFTDKSRWHFEKTPLSIEESLVRHDVQLGRRVPLRHQPASETVNFTSFDARGKVKKGESQGIWSVPTDLLASSLDRTLPIVRESYDLFREIQSRALLTIPQVVDKFREILQRSDSFHQYMGHYLDAALAPAPHSIDCVFIETQRLLFSKKNEKRDRDADSESAPREEILRQSQHLSTLLQKTHSNYAARSQDLDRSFPNRLIDRVSKHASKASAALLGDLEQIESRRKALTEAGILVESSSPLTPPTDETLPKVADALEIYAADSRDKLSVFDEIYSKVSVFKELLSKKLYPKELIISKDKGAEVKRGSKLFQLSELSSGEKHEFIMMFKLIFETPENSLVLIDEPEISLHVLWQLEFMSDLTSIQSANKFQSIIATHSPQIFQGMENLIVDLADQAP